MSRNVCGIYRESWSINGKEKTMKQEMDTELIWRFIGVARKGSQTNHQIAWSYI